ncbi:MAG: hypothetical protein ABR548_09320 [Actinomycetota bacterium]|nr:hypothetical protein [Actinomycetota bacterium]
MIFDQDRINPKLFWIVAGLGVVALLANVVLIVARPTRQPAHVLGEHLVTPTPEPAATSLPTLPPNFLRLPLSPQPSPTSDVLAEDEPADQTQEESAAPATTPSGGLVCRNSTNPSCGRFYWSPSPGIDKPIDIEVEWSPESPVAGDLVTFTVTITDPDAKITAYKAGFGDPSRAALPACSTPSRYGPWTPPARQAGSVSLVFRHIYESAGDYSANFIGRSGDCGSPYGETVNLPVPISVQEPEPEPSPEPSESPFL